MTDFFTPIEVNQGSERHTDQYEVEKYNNDPFMPTPVRIESLGDHRRKIISWLKAMPVASRVKKLTFTNKQFSCLLIAMFERISNRSKDCLQEFGLAYSPQQGYRIIEERFISKPNPYLLQAEHRLLESILVVNRYSRYDSVTVDSAMASDINALFDLFDVIENGISHELSFSNYQSYSHQTNSHILFYNPIDHDCSITKTLGLWFVEVMKKNLCIQYFQESLKPNFMANDLKWQEIGVQEQQKVIDSRKEKSKQFEKYWNSISLQGRQKLLEEVLNRDIRGILNEYRHTIKVSGDSFPLIKYCHPDQFNWFIEDLMQMEGEKLLDQLTYTQMDSCSFDVALYKYEIMLELETDVEKKTYPVINLIKTKSKPAKKAKKDTVIQKIIDETIKKPQIEGSAPEKIAISPQKQDKQGIDKKKKKKSLKTKKSKEDQGPKFETQTKDQSEKDDLDHKEIIQCDKEKNKELAGGQFAKVAQEFNNKTKKWQKHQEVAINRLVSVLAAYNLSYQVFGSYANGLAVPNSDVDICVNPTIIHYFSTYFCTYREKLIMGLQFLWGCFENMPWASSFKLITTASVPLLVFEIDLSIPFGDPKNLALNPAKLSKGPKVSIDLTIEPFADMQKELVPHLGYQSTALVKEWLIEFKPLGEMVRFFKHILMKKDLNKSFTGGLSSYALTSIVYSFLKADPHRRTKSLIELVVSFSSFIASFDERNTVISVFSDEPFEQRPANRLTVENYLNSKNITENCHRFQEIKALMVEVTEAIQGSTESFSLKAYSKGLKSLILQ